MALSVITILFYITTGFPFNQQDFTLGNSSYEGVELSCDLFVQLFRNIFDPPPEGKEL